MGGRERTEKSEKRLAFYRGKYCIYWRENGKPKRISLRTSDRDIAQQRFRDTLKLASRPAATVADCFERYLKDKPQEEKTWKPLKPFWESYRPDEINRTACKKYIKHREDSGVKAGTIHRELTILRAAINWTTPNSKAVYHLPKKPGPNEHYITKEEFKRLVDCAASPHLELFLFLAIGTAGRHSALVELKWDRVDFNRNLIRLSTGEEGINKGRATVPIGDDLRIELEKAYKGRLTDHVIEYGGKPVKSVRKAMERTAKKAGLYVTPHILRHSAAVWMAEAGVPIPEIAQYLGHSNPDITYRVYARYSPTYLKKASDALNVFN